MKIFFSIIFFLMAICTNGQLLSPLQINQLDSISIQDVPKGAPGIATGIVVNGQIVYEKVAGFADLSDSTLITRNSRFNIASNGKQFTALAILILIDEKKIKLSDDVRKYLATLFPKLTSTITIENLLNHTSGIRDVYDLWSLQGITWWKQTYNNNDVIKLVEQQQQLNFEPGTKYLYSNTNYILLASIIEKVSKKSFVSYTNDMFRKLKMPDTSFEDDYTKIRGPIARAYFNFDTWKNYNWIWNVYGDGNIFSTLSDQLQWEQVLQGKGNSKIDKAVLIKSQQLTENSTIKNYGYGLEFDFYKGLNYAFHEGATGAWKATVLRFPATKTSMVTLTNTGKSTTNTQTRQMADVFFGSKDNQSLLVTKPINVGSFISDEDAIGIYQTENDFTFQFEKRESNLYLKRIGRNDVQLEREADNIFHQTFDPDFKQEFLRNEKEEMTVTAYYTNHSPYTLTKATNNWKGHDFKNVEGKFINSETGVLTEIKYAGDRNYDVKIGIKNVTKGLLISPTKMLVDNYVFAFENASNSVKHFLLNGERIKSVKFLKIDNE